MIEKSVEQSKGLRKVASWFGLLGVIAAAAAVMLVPITLEPEKLNSVLAPLAYSESQLRMLLMIAVVLLVAVLGMLAMGERPVGVPVLVPVLILLSVSAASTLFSERPVHSLYGDRAEGLLSLAAGVLIFYALVRGLTSRSRVHLFLVATTITAVFISALGIAQNYGFDPLSGWGNRPFTEIASGRPFATIGNPLPFAAYLTLMMGAATALWLGAGTRVRRSMWLLALALIGASWIYTEARGAMLGAGVALPVVLLAARHRMGTMRPLLVPVTVLVAAMATAVAASKAFGYSTLSPRTCAVLLAYLALVGVCAWLLERGRGRLALVFLMVLLAGVGVAAFVATSSGNLSLNSLGLSRAEAQTSQGGDVSLQIRLYTWRDTIPMILDRPLLGHGPDNFVKPFQSYTSDGLNVLLGNEPDLVISLMDRAHNHFLQIAATTGLLGLGAYLWVLVSYFRNSYRRGGWILTALSGTVLAYVLQIQTAFPALPTDVAFWGVLGVSVALMRVRDGEDEEEPSGDAVGLQAPEVAGKVRGEPLVTAIVVGLLIAIALPVVLNQRERAADLQKERLVADVRRTVQLYKSTERARGTYPDAGVYTAENPIRGLGGRPRVLISTRGITITTKTSPEDSFTVEGKSTTYAGTFRYSYDSSNEEYTGLPPDQAG